MVVVVITYIQLLIQLVIVNVVCRHLLFVSVLTIWESGRNLIWNASVLIERCNLMESFILTSWTWLYIGILQDLVVSMIVIHLHRAAGRRIKANFYLFILMNINSWSKTGPISILLKRIKRLRHWLVKQLRWFAFLLSIHFLRLAARYFILIAWNSLLSILLASCSLLPYLLSCGFGWLFHRLFGGTILGWCIHILIQIYNNNIFWLILRNELILLVRIANDWGTFI